MYLLNGGVYVFHVSFDLFVPYVFGVIYDVEYCFSLVWVLLFVVSCSVVGVWGVWMLSYL